MASISIGFIGFGEVASILSKSIAEHGAAVAAYDILLAQDHGREKLQQRVQTEGIRFLSLAEVIREADYVLSAVTTQMAKTAAQECVKYLEPRRVYVDLNSTAPRVKIEIEAIIQSSGADFVEGAILGAVGAAGSRTHILTGGKRGEEVAEVLNRLGLRVSYYSAEIGKPSMFKMLRSIFSKGVEALLLELLVAGKRAGIEQDLWKDLMEFMTQNRFDHVAANWIQTHAVAYKRRYHEMVQVRETMQQLGVEPIMTSGTESFFQRSLELDWAKVFTEKANSVDAVIEFLAKQFKEKPIN